MQNVCLSLCVQLTWLLRLILLQVDVANLVPVLLGRSDTVTPI